MLMDLKPGDLVRLRSGSFPMTIRDIEGTTAFCVWRDECGEYSLDCHELGDLVSIEEELIALG